MEVHKAGTSDLYEITQGQTRSMGALENACPWYLGLLLNVTYTVFQENVHQIKETWSWWPRLAASYLFTESIQNTQSETPDTTFRLHTLRNSAFPPSSLGCRFQTNLNTASLGKGPPTGLLFQSNGPASAKTVWEMPLNIFNKCSTPITHSHLKAVSAVRRHRVGSRGISDHQKSRGSY